MEKDLIKDTTLRAFDISPSTVYGFLVGILVLAVIWLSYQLLRSQRQVVELNVGTIEVLKDLNTSLLLLKEEGVQLGSDLKEHLTYTREHVASLLEKYKT